MKIQGPCEIKIIVEGNIFIEVSEKFSKKQLFVSAEPETQREIDIIQQAAEVVSPKREQTKVCKKCGRELPLSAFHKSKQSKYGVKNICKEDCNRYMKEYHKKRKAEQGKEIQQTEEKIELPVKLDLPVTFEQQKEETEEADVLKNAYTKTLEKEYRVEIKARAIRELSQELASSYQTVFKQSSLRDLFERVLAKYNIRNQYTIYIQYFIYDGTLKKSGLGMFATYEVVKDKLIPKKKETWVLDKLDKLGMNTSEEK